jgi:uncharacterized protein
VTSIGLVSQVRVFDLPENDTYVIEFDGRRAGRLDYRLQPDRIALTHAEIDPELEGQGLGSELTAFALDDARRRGLSVLPGCPFVAAYIRDHAEYRDLVPEALRSRYRL